MLGPMVSRPVCLGIKHPSGAYDQIFISQTAAGLLTWGALSDKMGLSFTIAAGLRQHSNSRVRVPWDLWLRGADHIENTASSIVVYWKVFMEPLPSNAS
jgi:hypothetical protein